MHEPLSLGNSFRFTHGRKQGCFGPGKLEDRRREKSQVQWGRGKKNGKSRGDQEMSGQ